MPRNLLIAVLVLGELALIALAWSEHSRVAALAERVSQLELVDYRQETANKELESQINIARECINWLLKDSRVRAFTFCNQQAIATPAAWGYEPPGGEWRRDWHQSVSSGYWRRANHSRNRRRRCASRSG